MVDSIGIRSISVEDEYAGTMVYDVLGGSLMGAGKSIRKYASKLNPFSDGYNLLAHVSWEGSDFTLDAMVDVSRDLEFISDSEMEKYLLDSINRSVALDFCDSSLRADGLLDFAWDNHVDVICSAVEQCEEKYRGMMKLLDGKHEGIDVPVVHPKMARKLFAEGILDFTSDQFLKFMPREEIAKCLMEYQKFVADNLRQRAYDDRQYGFDAFYRREYLARFMAEPERSAAKESDIAR